MSAPPVSDATYNGRLIADLTREELIAALAQERRARESAELVRDAHYKHWGEQAAIECEKIMRLEARLYQADAQMTRNCAECTRKMTLACKTWAPALRRHCANLWVCRHCYSRDYVAVGEAV